MKKKGHPEHRAGKYKVDHIQEKMRMQADDIRDFQVWNFVRDRIYIIYIKATETQWWLHRDKYKDLKMQINFLCSNQIYISQVSQNRHNQPCFTPQKRGDKISTFGL